MSNSTPGVTDNPHAPDVYADAAAGWYVLNGNIRITFESARANHGTPPGPVNRMVIGRLVMPTVMAEQMCKEMMKFIEAQRAAAQPVDQGAPPPTLN